MKTNDETVPQRLYKGLDVLVSCKPITCIPLTGLVNEVSKPVLSKTSLSNSTNCEEKCQGDLRKPPVTCVRETNKCGNIVTSSFVK